MLGILLAAGVGTGAVVSVARGRTRTRRARPGDVRTLSNALRSSEPDAIGQALVALFGDGDAVFREAIVTGGDPGPAVAALNEHLADVDKGLSLESGRFGASTRIAFSGGTLGGVLELSRAVSSHSGSGYVLAAAAFFTGCVSAGACFEIGRRAAAEAAQIRREWDQIASEIAKRLARADESGGGPSRRTWSSRKGGR